MLSIRSYFVADQGTSRFLEAPPSHIIPRNPLRRGREEKAAQANQNIFSGMDPKKR